VKRRARLGTLASLLSGVRPVPLLGRLAAVVLGLLVVHQGGCPRGAQTVIDRGVIELPLCNEDSSSLTFSPRDRTLRLESTGQTLRLGEPDELAIAGALVRVDTWGDETTARVRWAQIGVLDLKVGDLVGRAPTVDFAPGFVAGCPTVDVGGATVRLRSAWIDGLPLRGFTMLPSDDPTRVRLRVHAPHATFEQRTQSRTRKFQHLVPDEEITITRRSQTEQDALWINGVPFAFGERRGSLGAWIDIEALQRFHDVSTASMVTWQDEVAIDENHPAELLAIGRVAKGGLLRARRIEPDRENAWQAALDADIVCLRWRQVESRIVTEAWIADPRAGCPDPFGRRSEDRGRDAPRWLLEIADRLRQDPILARLNARLASGPLIPESLPFYFEWWRVRAPNGTQVPVPIAIRALRSRLSTRWQLATPPIELGAPEKPTREPSRPPKIYAHPANGEGDDVLLAELDDHGNRVYTAEARTLNLMPLLGVRGATDGLDDALPLQPAGTPLVQITIDPKLQDAVNRELTKLLAEPFKRHGAFHVTAAAIDPASGALLGSWTIGGPGIDEAHAIPAENGVPRPSQNFAGLRARKVGSVMKLIDGVTMARRGLLDDSASSDHAGKPCLHLPLVDTPRRPASRRLNFLTDSGLDARLPIGERALSAGFESAFRASCNGYFSMAGTAILGNGPPLVWQQTSECPEDPPVSGLLECLDGGERRVMLPEATKLAELARQGRDPTQQTLGWYGVAELFGVRTTGEPAFAGRPIWFGDVPGARARVFAYPTAPSFAESTQEGPWLGFARVVVGLAPTSGMSAYALAELYTLLGRDDGAVALPRIRVGSQVRLQPIIGPAYARSLARLKEAAAEVVQPGGTGFAPMRGKVPKDISLIGKTGSYHLDSDPVGEGARELDEEELEEADDGCAVAMLGPTGAFSASTETLSPRAHCEISIPPPIDRFPEETTTITPQQRVPSGKKVQRAGSSFVAVIGRGDRRVVFAVIVDGPEPKAIDVTADLMSTISDWLRQ
jgi:hypothetical protein